ncbi:ABC transporter permease [Nonomuraea longicatena]|uniref:Transport permease protein n=1 Tax=Nonomuraea longicatena TaxID=83682 RepID=A0ABN1R013_9ACTN
MSTLGYALADGMTIAKRNVIKIRRSPDWLGVVLVTPIMFVVLFGYVFGSSIEIPGMSYREYLLPGIFVQAVIFGATLAGYGLTEDLQRGAIDRFRTLPMAPSAVLVGRTASDVLANVASLVVMTLTGLLVGWRIDTSVGEAMLGFAILLLFAYSLSWVWATVALLIRTPESYNSASSVVVFPLAFVANTFVQSSRLPGPLETIAEWNPVSAVAQAARELFGNTSAAMPVSDAWPLQNAVLASLLWSALILAVFVPLATRMYRKAVSR